MTERKLIFLPIKAEFYDDDFFWQRQSRMPFTFAKPADHPPYDDDNDFFEMAVVYDDPADLPRIIQYFDAYIHRVNT